MTLWVESAGAMSVGYHLTAYGGRDDKPLRAGLMETGGSIAGGPSSYTMFQATYDKLVSTVGCSDT